MSIGKGKRTPKGLTNKQATAVKVVHDRVAAGEPLSRNLINEAHDIAYELNGNAKLASTMAGQNLQRSQFLAALAMDNSEVQAEVKTVLFQCLRGEHPLFLKDKDLMMLALKLAVRSSLAEKHEVKYTEAEFEGKTVPELDYYAANSRYPTQSELSYFLTHKSWPSANGATGSIQ